MKRVSLPETYDEAIAQKLLSLPPEKRQQVLSAAAELKHRKRLKEDLIYFAEHAAPFVVDPEYDHTPAKHHRLILHKLQQVANGEIKRLCIFLPPGSAKSTYSTLIFGAWYLISQGHRNIICASHTGDFAEKWSRKTQDLLQHFEKEIGILPITTRADDWKASNESTYKAVGIGGPITGERANLILIDDPIKSRTEAYSPTIRQTGFKWLTVDAITRLKPNAPVILIQTRWHQDDVGGRVLEEFGDRWEVIDVPAVWDRDYDEKPFPNGMGRSANSYDLLWPEYHDQNFIDEKIIEIGTQDFSALYQQRPMPAEGGMFQTALFEPIAQAPANPIAIWRGWDTAATADTKNSRADYTVGVLMQKNRDGSFTVVDVIRQRVDGTGLEALLLQTAKLDCERYGPAVRISIPQGPADSGKILAKNYVQLLAGYNVSVTVEGNKSKDVRALPFAAQVGGKNVSIVMGPWNREYLDELGMFPGGRHDDQVDASSRAFNQMITPAVQFRRASVSQGVFMHR